jgi:hypothetical protein
MKHSLRMRAATLIASTFTTPVALPIAPSIASVIATLRVVLLVLVCIQDSLRRSPYADTVERRYVGRHKA